MFVGREKELESLRFHLEGVPVLSAVPYEKRASKGQRKDDGKGLQIDLLVQTRKSAYVVEVKRKRHIGEAIEEDVAQKVSRLRHALFQ